MDRFTDYRWASGEQTAAHSYIWPKLLDLLATRSERRIFEIGCGNGATARMLEAHGYDVTGVDPSIEGIAQAANPKLRAGDAYDDLSASYGQFPIVLSLEVIEHCFYPRAFARTSFGLTQPGGVALISTPFHGYWKNLALAASGKMDSHFTALWDGGHIKFWSERTLRALLLEAGFSSVRFARVGRIHPLAKSMIAIATH